jgi:hypothetical protein
MPTESRKILSGHNRRKRLKPDEVKFIKILATEGISQQEAYLKVHPEVDKELARKRANRIMRKPSAKNILEVAMRAKGVDEGSIADVLVELRNEKNWKAKESYIKYASKFLGIDSAEASGVKNLTINVKSYNTKEDDDDDKDSDEIIDGEYVEDEQIDS